MTNRLLQLEKNLTRSHVRRRRDTTRQASPPHGNGSAGPAVGTPAAASATRARLARGLGAVDYTVPGTFTELAQPTGMTCWATCFTMMMSWYHQRSMSIEATLRAHAGDRWADMFLADQGLSSGDKPVFISCSSPRLVEVPPSNHTVEGYEQMLRSYGPLWITTNEAPGTGWAIHARILAGISGDGTSTGTNLDIIDPAGGRRYAESFETFWPKFEDEARRIAPTTPLRIQIVHFEASPRSQSKSGSAAAEPLPVVIAGLLTKGVSRSEIDAALEELGIPASVRAQSMSASGGVPLSLPGVTLRAEWQTPLILAGLSAVSPLLGGLAVGVLEISQRNNVTIGVGPSVAGGAVAAASLGAGLVFAPGRRIGFYGSAAVNLGAIVSVQGTLQLTVIHGGPENFGGNAVAFGANVGGAGITAGAQALFSPSGQFLGVTGEIGVSAGLSPFEAFAGYQTVGTTLSRNGFARVFEALALSDPGLKFISRHEGLRTSLYDDPAGHCTIGYGHLVHLKPCDGRDTEGEFAGGISEARALELLRADSNGAADAVRKHVTVDLNQCQFDALVSFVFNVGAGAFAGSTLLRRLNAGDWAAVPTEMARWVKAGGKTLPGLVSRRQHEADLFTTGRYES